MTDHDAGTHGPLLTSTSDALVALDSDGFVTDLNPSATELLDLRIGDDLVRLLRPATLAGRPAVPDGWPPRVRRLGLSTRLAEQELSVATGPHREGRSEVAVTVRFARAGADHSAVLALRDLSSRRRHELTSAELVTTVSHELRSPLASVKGYTATLLHRWDRINDEDKRFMIEQVNYDADRVTRLITELLDVSRLESGRLKLRPEWIDLRDITARVVGKLAFAHADAVVEISFVEEFPPVYADEDKVEQVLTNLIENAAKYGDAATIEVSGAVNGRAVEVSVSDRGEGLDSDALPRVFSKFYRAENRDGRPTGTGLGLYISRGLAEAHGGSLVAASEKGVGATFTLTLPLGMFS